MSNWMEAVPALGVTLVVIFVPGGVLVALVGARGLNLLALAAPVSFTLAGVGAVVAGILGLPFSPVVFGAFMIAMWAGAALLRLWTRRRETRKLALNDVPGRGPGSLDGWLTLAAALAVPAAIIGFRYARGIQSPENVSQLFDNVYHLNAVRYVLDTGNGSSLTIGNLTDSSTAFYPAAMHDLFAVVTSLSGGDIPVVMNTTAIVMAAVVWPLSCIFLATRLLGQSPTVLLFTGIVSAGFAAFPFRLVSFGVLYPLHAAVAMAPALLGLIVELVRTRRLGGSTSGVFGTPTPGLLTMFLALVAPGIALCHPSALVAVALLAVPFVGAWALQRPDAPSPPGTRVSRSLIAAGYLIAALGAWIRLRPDLGTAPWLPTRSVADAIKDFFSAGPLELTTSWGMLALLVVGTGTAIVRFRTHGPLLVGFLFGGFLYVACASFPDGWWRDALAGNWYRDTIRVAALATVLSVPLAALGAVTILRAAQRASRAVLEGRAAPRAQTAANLALLAILAVLVTVTTQRGPVSTVETYIHETFTAGEQARLLSDDERELLEALPVLIPEDGVIVGDPRTGASLAYALADRSVIAPHIFGERTAQEKLLLEHWQDAAADPAVCAAAAELNAYWAVDFGNREVLGGESHLGGTDGLASATPEGVREIARVGDVAAFELTACGSPAAR